MNTKIIPVPPSDAPNFHYYVGHEVVRVFDTNGVGHLIPVPFSTAPHSFYLCFAPHGQIYAEVAI